MTDTDEVRGPLRGVRIVEDALTPAARMAGMLLADLGADVTRIAGADEDLPVGNPAYRRGKREVSVPVVDCTALSGLLASADIFLSDRAPGELARRSLGEAAVRPVAPDLVHLWMPPYGTTGEWSDSLPPDPLLLAALSGIAAHQPSIEDRPVASVIDLVAPVQGALGATAAVAGLVGRARDGAGRGAVVSGLHAVAALMVTMMLEGLDEEVFNPGKATQPTPSWRMYQAGDELWFFLAALTPEGFVRALDGLDRLDLLLIPEIAGDPARIQVPEAGAVVGAVLQDHFRTQPRAHWLALLQDAQVPCAPAATREQWAGGNIVAGNGGLVTRAHPSFGDMTMPDLPVRLSRDPGAVGSFAGGEATSGRAGTRPPDAAPARETASPDRLPLHGIRVVDLSSFLAGPSTTAFLAQHGADVVKVEPPAGDPYRTYSISYLAVNQRKRSVALDLRRETDRETFRALAAQADVLVENLRPGRLERLGLSAESLEKANPALVHCSVSAFGSTGDAADLPGFDPVFQCLSGLAVAQGGASAPIVTNVAVHDTGTGALSALGIAAALYARFSGHGLGQRVHTSLAQTATFAQFDQFTEYPGHPDHLTGAVDFPGPHPGRRYHLCRDGWVALACDQRDRVVAMVAALSNSAQRDPAEIGALLEALTVQEAIATAVRHGVPACPVLDREGEMWDEYLRANGFGHVVRHHRHGRMAVVRGFATWSSGIPRESASTEPGDHTAEILAELGREQSAGGQ
ncbi:CaiB/BaiF CoA-transferase family protein [Nocardia jinanensis]|nr:CoA transferase [Nocardia jinanensis]